MQGLQQIRERDSVQEVQEDLITELKLRIADLETYVDLLQNELFEMRKGKDSQEVISELMSRIKELETQVAVLKKITESTYPVTFKEVKSND